MDGKGTRRFLVLCFAASTLMLGGVVQATDTDFTDGITVDSVLDAADSNPGDGICDDGAGNCTLRAAIQEANLNPGEDIIYLTGISDPNNPIILSINGVDESWADSPAGSPDPYVVVDNPDASVGDLDITDSIQIIGAGSGNTVIEWSEASRTDGDPSTGDRIFQAQAVDANITLAISGLTLMNGSVGIPNSEDPANPYNIEVNPDGSIWQFKRQGGAICLGGGAAVALFTPSTHGGGGDGGPPTGGEGEEGFAIESATLTDVTVVNNSSGADGGGLYNASPLTLSQSLFWGNLAGANGGAVYNDAAASIVDTTLGPISSDVNSTANHAENGGGLFDTGSHTTDIVRSAINGNTATGGGAIAGRSLVRINITNSTIDGNSATDVGGGVTTNGTIHLLNSTVTDNSAVSDADFGGGGLNSFGSGTYILKNTLLSGNTVATNAANCGCTGGSCTGGNQFVSQGHNLEDAASCDLQGTGDIENTDPQLKVLANNGGRTDTRALPSIAAGDAVTSAAIDAGDDNGCPNNDQREGIRPADGNLDGTLVCDIGAFELFIHTADLHIQNMIAADRSVKDEDLPVTIEIHNGPEATASASNVVMSTDPLDADVTIKSAELVLGTATTPCTIANQVVTCSIGTLDVDQVATVNLELTPTRPGVMTVVAKVTADAPADPIPENNTASTSTLVVGSADMSLKGAFQQSVIYVGTPFSAVLTITNNGPHEATEPRFTGSLTGDVTIDSISSPDGLCRMNAGAYVCEFGTMQVGDKATIRISGTVNSATTVVVDGQVVSAPEDDPDTTNNVGKLTVDVTESLVPPTGGTADSGGGCAYDPRAPFDPTLLILAAAGLAGLAWKLRKATRGR
ncbi:MAG: choice-of-anchor Q domain-containing protein [Gammaproteobacteria bacterium]|jgi:CSLREA domain-containing protein